MLPDCMSQHPINRIIKERQEKSMTTKEFLDIIKVSEKLKNQTRHSYTSEGRHESVAEHSWRISLMAMLLTHEEEFQSLDINRVIRMCLIHDLGEIFTGDVPAFEKTEKDSETEDVLYMKWVKTFPLEVRGEFEELLAEMNAMETREAKLYKALDKIEALIQHNEADLSTWLPLEYDLQFTYGKENMSFSPYMTALREEIDNWTAEKIGRAPQA